MRIEVLLGGIVLCGLLLFILVFIPFEKLLKKVVADQLLLLIIFLLLAYLLHLSRPHILIVLQIDALLRTVVFS